MEPRDPLAPLIGVSTLAFELHFQLEMRKYKKPRTVRHLIAMLQSGSSMDRTTSATADEKTPSSGAADGAWRGRQISLHNISAGFVVADVLSVIVAGAFLAGVIGEFRSFEPVLADWQVWALALGICAHLIMARMLGVYSTRTIFSKRRTIYRLTLSLISAFIALLIIAVATKTSGNYSRRWFFSWMFLSISLVTVICLFALERLRRVLREGAFVYKAFSIGVFCDPISPREIARRTNNEVRVAESLRLGAINELASMSERIAKDEIDRVYIAAPWVDIPAVLRNLLLLRHLATRVFIVPGDQRAYMNVVGISFLGDKPMFCAIEEPMQGWSLWLKRVRGRLHQPRWTLHFIAAVAGGGDRDTPQQSRSNSISAKSSWL